MAHIGDLKSDARNARRHTPRNVGMIESSLQRDGFGRSILLANDGTILAGNATADAAAQAGIERVRIVESDGTEVIAVKRVDVAPDSERARLLALADNRAAELAEWDPDALAALNDEMDLSGLFRDDELVAVLANLDEPPPVADGAYSRSVESPVYAITGDCPAIGELVDTAKADALLAQIDAADIPDATKRFLRFAAYRHLRFDYAKVAEFYAHADAAVQDLMERSALVIIDVDQAIEYGFARLVDELRELAGEADDAA